MIKVQSAEAFVPGRAGMQFAGQAGFILQSENGRRLAVDVYLSECVERLEGHIGFKRLLPYIIRAEDLKADYIVATHAHYDHFDYDSMKEMMDGGETRLFASYGCRALAEELGIQENLVKYVKEGDSFETEDFNISFSFCDHGAAAPDAVSVIIETAGKRILMAGDTCLRRDKLPQIADLGPFDIVIGPINGHFGNMNEADFAEYVTYFRPQIAIPCHYGMFASHGGNPGAFWEIMRQQDKTLVYLMRQGEVILF